MAPYGHISPEDSQASLKEMTVASKSWVLVDSTGKAKILDVDKYAIMERLEINARDLRILDPLLSYPSTILVREKAIVLNLEHIKAIITADEVLLRDPLNENIIPIVEELKRRLPFSDLVDQESPFEFRALEVALEAICSFLGARTTELETAAYPVLDELTSKISSRNMDRIRKLKSALTSLTTQVQKVRDQLEQLMNDDDMAELYLSRKLAGASSLVYGSGGPYWFPASPTKGSKTPGAITANFATFHRNENEFEELEMILEAYFMDIDESLSKLTTLRGFIGDTEDFINIKLDNRRNQIIQLDLFVTSASFCLDVYSVAITIFSTNFLFSWNNGTNTWPFTMVCVLPAIAAVIILMVLVSYYRRKGLIGS